MNAREVLRKRWPVGLVTKRFRLTKMEAPLLLSGAACLLHDLHCGALPGL